MNNVIQLPKRVSPLRKSFDALAAKLGFAQFNATAYEQEWKSFEQRVRDLDITSGVAPEVVFTKFVLAYTDELRTKVTKSGGAHV